LNQSGVSRVANAWIRRNISTWNMIAYSEISQCLDDKKHLYLEFDCLLPIARSANVWMIRSISTWTMTAYSEISQCMDDKKHLYLEFDCLERD
jgi:hypothetical protein